MARPTVEQLRPILEGVAGDMGVPVSLICSTDNDPQTVLARRRFMAACRDARASSSVISAALGRALSVIRISRMLAAPALNGDDLTALGAFRRGAGFVPLTAEDFARRAGVSMDAARAMLKRLGLLGLCSIDETRKIAGVRIYDLTETGREALLA